VQLTVAALPPSLLSRPARLALLGMGGICLALGALGILLPVLPTTILWIGAAACFSKASPRLAARLARLPCFGHAIVDWLTCGALARRGKILAIGGTSASLTLIVLLLEPAGWVSLLLGMLWLVTIGFVATRREYCEAPSAGSPHLSRS
jgi:hypothetical protein